MRKSIQKSLAFLPNWLVDSSFELHELFPIGTLIITTGIPFRIKGNLATLCYML